MDFPCEDFFEESEDSGPVADKAEAARASYEPRICSSVAMSDLSGDENFVKMSADYHYLLKHFAKAKILYKQVLDTSGISRSAAVRRDVVEGLARCCLQLGEFEEAKEFSDSLYSSSVPSNIDHMTVSTNLQFDIAAAASTDEEAMEKTSAESSDLLMQDYWLRSLIELHPLVPRYWLSLAKLFKKKGKRMECFFCLVRANELLRAVEKSVGSFAKDNNAKMKLLVEESMAELGTLERTYASVKVSMTSDIFGKNENIDTGDFEDLGRSARLKKMEEAFAEKDNDTQGDEDYEEFIFRFNQKWFAS